MAFVAWRQIVMSVSADGIQGCIFDFDGTIVISEQIHMRAWIDLEGATGRKLPHGFLEASVGQVDRDCAERLALAWNHEMPDAEILKRKKEFYLRRCPDECLPVPGVIEIVAFLSARKIPLAVATSSTRVEVLPVLTRLGLLDSFKHVWTVEDVRSAKPDPEIYRMAANSLGLAPRQCLAFEDSKAGTTSARDAGCELITLQTIYTSEELGPALLSIKDYQDPGLMPLLRRMLAD
jgi:HAD superfamily hydrolase (TIGR01509 family)